MANGVPGTRPLRAERRHGEPALVSRRGVRAPLLVGRPASCGSVLAGGAPHRSAQGTYLPASSNNAWTTRATKAAPTTKVMTSPRLMAPPARRYVGRAGEQSIWTRSSRNQASIGSAHPRRLSPAVNLPCPRSAFVTCSRRPTRVDQAASRAAASGPEPTARQERAGACTPVARPVRARNGVIWRERGSLCRRPPRPRPASGRRDGDGGTRTPKGPWPSGV